MEDKAQFMEDKAQLLKDEIRKDARKKADRVLKKAAREAKDILSQAEQNAQQLREEAAVQNRREAEARSGKILAGTSLEIKKLRLEEIYRFCSETAEEGVIRLEQLDGQEADRLCLEQLRLGLEKLADREPAVLISPQTDRNAVEAELQRLQYRATVESDPQLHRAEIILRARDGSRRYEAVFRRMYEMDKLKYLRAVYAAVFGGADE